ncbi:MFS transporter [Rhodococcus aerolatus]
MPSTRPRLALLALALGGFGIGTTEFVAMGLLPDIARDLDVTLPAAGSVVSAYALGVVVGAPLIAALAARVPRRTLLVWLMVAYGAGNLLTTVVAGYPAVLLARFLTGLPHGAYFGVAALTATTLVAPHRRASAVATVMLGLSVANVVGVPVATVVGQHAGWRAAYLLVAGLAALTVVALLAWVPASGPSRSGGVVAELGALRRPQVLLALAVGVVGFGGMFALYTYISPVLTRVSGLPESAVPLVLALFGLGMVVGNLAGGRIADRALLPGLVGLMVCLAVTLAAFTLVAGNPVAAVVTVVLVAVSGAALVPGLQTRLMDTAGDAQTLAAALNHSALNVANALGAWLGGLVIAAGLGFRAPALLGAGLAVAGLGVLAVSVAVQRRSDRREVAVREPVPA